MSSASISEVVVISYTFTSLNDNAQVISVTSAFSNSICGVKDLQKWNYVREWYIYIYIFIYSVFNSRLLYQLGFNIHTICTKW